MAFQAEIIPFNLRTGTGDQTVFHSRYPNARAKGVVFFSTDNSGTNSETYSYGLDDGVTHIGVGMGATQTFGVCLTARGYSSQFSLVKEQAQAFFGGAQMRYRGYVSAMNVGSFVITTDLNNTPGAQWYAVVISGDGVFCTVGVHDADVGPFTISLTYQPAAVLFVNSPLDGTNLFTGEVAGASTVYGFGVPCGPNQVSWGVSGNPIDSGAKNYQIVSIIQAIINGATTIGTVPSSTKFVSGWPADAFSIDGTSFAPVFTDFQIGYMAVGGPAISANLVRFDQPTSIGVQNVAIDAADPVLALFASTDTPTAAGVNADALISMGAYDGLSQVAHWWGLTDGAAFPYQRATRASVSQSLILATATGPGTSTLHAQAACTGLTSQNVALNWTTVDATAREGWMLVFANDPGTGVCGAPVPPSPCGPSAPAIPSNPVSPIGGGGSASGSGGVIV